MSPDMEFERLSAHVNDRLQVTWAVGRDSTGIAVGFPDGGGDINGIDFAGADDFFAFREAVNDLYDHIRKDSDN